MRKRAFLSIINRNLLQNSVKTWSFKIFFYRLNEKKGRNIFAAKNIHLDKYTLDKRYILDTFYVHLYKR